MKYLNIGLIAFFLISISNIAHSGTMIISEKIEVVTDEECWLVINQKNSRLISSVIEQKTDFEIVYNGYIYTVLLWDKDIKKSTIECSHKQSFVRE